MVPLQIHVGSVVAEDSFSNIHRPKTGFMAENIAATTSTLTALATDKAVKVSKHPHRLSAVARQNQMQKKGGHPHRTQNRKTQPDQIESQHHYTLPAFWNLVGNERKHNKK